MADVDIQKVVREANDRWNETFNSGDAAAVAQLYTKDGTVLPHTHAVVKGTDAITEFWSGMIAAGVRGHGIEVLDAQRSGDLAFSSGRWWAEGTGEDGKPTRFEGTIVTIFKRQANGDWKTCLHTWN